MSVKIYRSQSKPIREKPSFNERWRDEDKGLITCWEVGRKMRDEKPDIAQRAERGELPPLGWKGGIEKGTKIKK